MQRATFDNIKSTLHFGQIIHESGMRWLPLSGGRHVQCNRILATDKSVDLSTVYYMRFLAAVATCIFMWCVAQSYCSHTSCITNAYPDLVRTYLYVCAYAHWRFLPRCWSTNSHFPQNSTCRVYRFSASSIPSIHIGAQVLTYMYTGIYYMLGIFVVVKSCCCRSVWHLLPLHNFLTNTHKNCGGYPCVLWLSKR